MSSPPTRKSAQTKGTSQCAESVENPSQPTKRLSILLVINDSSIVELLRSKQTQPKARATHDDLMGAAYSKEPVGTEQSVVVDSPMTGAANTLVYHLQYGGEGCS